MSHYRKIDTRIWNDQKFQALSDDGKLAFLFILTHPNLTSFGAMRATMDGLGAELGWPPGRFLEGLREGLLEGCVEHNQRACYIGLKNFIKYNGPENFNVLKGMLKLVELLPECHERDEMFRRTIEHVVNEKQKFSGQHELFVEQLRKLLPEGLSKGLGKGYGDSLIPDPRSLNPINTPQPPKGGEPKKVRSRKSYDAEFEQFWETTKFPKKEQDDKGGMFKKYSAAIKAGLTAAEIATAADAFADGNADNQFPIGMRRFLEPMTIREWLSRMKTDAPSAPSAPVVSDDRLRRHIEKLQAQQQVSA
jgi:hypothetical protein